MISYSQNVKYKWCQHTQAVVASGEIGKMKTEMAYEMERSFVSYCSAGKEVVITGRRQNTDLHLMSACTHPGEGPRPAECSHVTPKPVFNTILKRA